MPARTRPSSAVKEYSVNVAGDNGWQDPDIEHVASPLGFGDHRCEAAKSPVRRQLPIETHDAEGHLFSLLQQELGGVWRFSWPGVETLQFQQELLDVQARLDTVERAVNRITARHGTALEQVEEGFVGALRRIGDVHCVAAVEDAEGYRVVTFMDGWNIEAERAVYRAEYDFLRTAGDILIDFLLIPNADEETITEASSQMTVLYYRQ